MKTNYIKVFLIISMISLQYHCESQNAISLDYILQSVLDNSYNIKTSSYKKKDAELSYKLFKSQLKPVVGLFGDIPAYRKTSTPVVQPDGTINFQSIRQANSSLAINASQILHQTGGQLYLLSNLNRFDDLSLDSKQYNGIPIRLGIVQPILGFNPWKYQKNIQSALLEEAKHTYNVEIEQSLGTAVSLYFDILIAKQNLEISKTNQEVNEKLLAITEERLLLGKVSRDEKLQLEIELNTSKLAVSQAISEVEQSIARLSTFSGLKIAGDGNQFEIPESITTDNINIAALLSYYKTHRPEMIQFHRELSENKMNLAQTKTDYGVRADLEASIGFARGADNIGDIYRDPFDEQFLNMSFALPLIDWGQRKSAIGRIKLEKENIENTFAQTVIELENTIEQNALRMMRMQNEIELLKEIMDKAEERFQISNDRYVLGDIDITNLTIAQREKDQTKRNYLNALKLYWILYYELRALTGFDIINNKEIIY